MAFGSNVFFRSYKNKSIQDLERILTELKTSPCFSSVNRAIKAGKASNDSNASLHQNHISIIEMLIKYKTMYPESNLSNCNNYKEIERVVEDEFISTAIK